MLHLGEMGMGALDVAERFGGMFADARNESVNGSSDAPDSVCESTKSSLKPFSGTLPRAFRRTLLRSRHQKFSRLLSQAVRPIINTP